MKLFFALLIVAYIPACLLLIVVVLAQEGKGGGVSGLIGGGSPLGDTLGASGAEAVYRKWTRIIAAIFLAGSLLITLSFQGIAKQSDQSDSLAGVKDESQTAVTTQEAAPADTGGEEPAATNLLETISDSEPTTNQ
ncbi:preprotein translocase subunit SecG [Candidatus Sumerlaeota bacterium]|nr:preprotein translocase subunit SecG [Candidatus Sumerlaeota bacterium]